MKLRSPCAPVEYLIEAGKESNGRDGRGQKIADRLCQKDAEAFVCHKMGQDKNEGDEQDDLAQAGQQEAHLRLTQRHKALLAGDLNAHRKDAGHIDAHGPCGIVDQGGIRSEDARHHAGHGHHKQPEQGGVAETKGELEAERLLDPGLFACAEVEAHDRLAALTDTLNGQGAQLGHAGDDGHRAYGDVAAIAGEAGAEADGKQALRREHDEGRDAQPQHRQDDAALHPEVLFAEFENRLRAGEELQDPAGTHGLTEHRRHRCAPDAPAKAEDEDGVEDDIDDCTDDGGEHTDLRKALRRDKGVHAHDQQHEYRAEDIDAAIGHRVREGGVAGAKKPQQGGRTGIEADRQHHGEEEQHGKAVANDLFGVLFVALPQCDGCAGRTARADEHGEGVQKHEDGGEQAHACQRRRADALDMADVDAVYDVIEQIDHLRHHGGDHQLQKQGLDRPAAHILSILCCHRFSFESICFKFEINIAYAAPPVKGEGRAQQKSEGPPCPAVQPPEGLFVFPVDGKAGFCYNNKAVYG